MSTSPVLATLRLTTSSGPLAYDRTLMLRQRGGRKVGHLTGRRDDVLLHATVRSRRDSTLMAVVEAARGRYYLVPLQIDGSTGYQSLAGLETLVNVVGMQSLWLSPDEAKLVAIVDHSRALIVDGRRTLMARG